MSVVRGSPGVLCVLTSAWGGCRGPAAGEIGLGQGCRVEHGPMTPVVFICLHALSVLKPLVKNSHSLNWNHAVGHVAKTH